MLPLVAGILSLLSGRFHVLRIFLIPGFCITILYSLLTNGAGPEGWGHTEVMIMTVGSAISYLLVGACLIYRKLATAAHR